MRSDTRWEHPEIPPEHRRYTASDIEVVAAKFKDIEAELSKLIRAINEDRRAELGR